MIARGSGTIVDIASLSAIAPTPYMPWYSASKAALAAASETLHGELRGTGVHCVTVYPGPVDTAMARNAMVRFNNAKAATAAPSGTTEELARLVRNAIVGKHDRIIYPRSYWTARWFPGITRFVLDRFAPKPT
jgi:short-subunit dehydrogenase